MVRRMKEECCYVQVEGAEGGDAAWLLPDGTPVTLPARLRTQPSEVLFSPSDHTGSEELGVHRLLHRSVMSCDIDVRSRLFESIELVGGGTMMTGLPERVLKEVRPVEARSEGFSKTYLRSDRVWYSRLLRPLPLFAHRFAHRFARR